MPLICREDLHLDAAIQSTTSRTTLDRALIWEVLADCNQIPEPKHIQWTCSGKPVADAIMRLEMTSSRTAKFRQPAWLQSVPPPACR